MSQIALSLGFRQRLWESGWGGLDSAFRFAIVELDLWFMSPRLHWSELSDGEQRHFTNFLAWSDTTLSGINGAIRKIGHPPLSDRWAELDHTELRRTMRDLRNVGLKERRDAAPWVTVFSDVGGVALSRRLLTTGPAAPAFGTCEDYLRWIKDEAFPLALEAIDRGARGPLTLDVSLAIADQMPFPDSDPWRARDDPEIQSLLNT